MVQRKVRWNRKTDAGEQTSLRYRYIVAIINGPREIGIIKERFYEQLGHVAEINKICERIITGSNGLHGLVYAFSSDAGRIIYPNKIYSNPEQFRRDRSLVEKHEMWAYAYIGRILD